MQRIARPLWDERIPVMVKTLMGLETVESHVRHLPNVRKALYGGFLLGFL